MTGRITSRRVREGSACIIMITIIIAIMNISIRIIISSIIMIDNDNDTVSIALFWSDSSRSADLFPGVGYAS